MFRGILRQRCKEIRGNLEAVDAALVCDFAKVHQTFGARLIRALGLLALPDLVLAGVPAAREICRVLAHEQLTGACRVGDDHRPSAAAAPTPASASAAGRVLRNQRRRDEQRGDEKSVHRFLTSKKGRVGECIRYTRRPRGLMRRYSVTPVSDGDFHAATLMSTGSLT